MAAANALDVSQPTGIYEPRDPAQRVLNLEATRIDKKCLGSGAHRSRSDLPLNSYAA
jgi:hypothetical protein